MDPTLPSPDSPTGAPPTISTPGADPKGVPVPATAMSTADLRTLHIWQIQPVRDVLVLAAVFGLFYLGYKISLVTVPLLLALALAYLFEPVVARLTRGGHLSRKGVVIGIIAAIVLAVLGPISAGLGFGTVQGISFAGKLVSNIQAVKQAVDNPSDARFRERIRGESWRKISDYLIERRQGPGEPDPSSPPPLPTSIPLKDQPPAKDWKPTSEVAGEQPPPDMAADDRFTSDRKLVRTIMNWVEEHAASIGTQVGKTAVGSGAQVASFAFGTTKSIAEIGFKLFLTLFFFFFLSTGWGRVVAWGRQFIPNREAGEQVRWIRIIRRMDRVIAGFVRGRLTICAILAVFMTIAYWLIGVPAPLVLGPIIGMLFIVPFVHVIGVPIAMLLMWLQADATGFRGEWWWIVFAPIGVYMGAQFLDDWVLTPIIQGNNTDMDTPTILFASMAGGALAGIYGLLLAIPAAACLKILIKEFLWPRVDAWMKGKSRDFLPLS